MTRGDGHVPRVMMDSEYQSDDRVTKQFISQPVSWPAHCLCLEPGHHAKDSQIIEENVNQTIFVASQFP